MHRMYSFLFVTIGLVFTFSLNAQNDQKDFLPKKGDWGTSIVVNGLIDNVSLSTSNNSYGQNLLFGKYYLADDLALRIGFGLNIKKTVRESSDSSGVLLIEVDSIQSNYHVNLSAGIEKHLTTYKRLDPYIFTQFDISLIGKTKNENERREVSTVGTSTTNRQITRDGGVALGLNFGGGFNYFLAKNFSLGSELYLGLQYVSVGGGISDNTTSTTSGGVRSSTFSTREDISKSTTLNVNPTAQINISYFF